MPEGYIFWFEELGQDQNSLVGRKCANLGEMAKIGLPVPPGFALSVEAYQEFMAQTNARREIENYLTRLPGEIENIEQFNQASRDIRQIVESKQMPETIKNAILSFYEGLCRRCDCVVAVSTRSAGPVSHPGQYETYLNVKGKADLLEKIKKVWASSFNPRSLAFRKRKGLPLESDPIGVAVLKMVNARAAGVVFTADPNTGDTSRMIIEANWGLGESVVSGELMPDVYILKKETLEIVEKRLGKKSKYVTCKDLGVAEEDCPADLSSSYCLGDEEAKEIGRVGILLEKHFGVPQDIEWAIDRDLPVPRNITLLQTRAAVIAQKKAPVDQVVDMMLTLFSKG
ncbi:MAG TPA: PEP/pyruvate-binding domain-containing protein [Thermodesulfobacteriota bacterium]|nr:PEP/pyruvate-binding domain-containing protein [Thermodesulfobacteriota bacterium]